MTLHWKMLSSTLSALMAVSPTVSMMDTRSLMRMPLAPWELKICLGWRPLRLESGCRVLPESTLPLLSRISSSFAFHRFLLLAISSSQLRSWSRRSSRW